MGARPGELDVVAWALGATTAVPAKAARTASAAVALRDGLLPECLNLMVPLFGIAAVRLGSPTAEYPVPPRNCFAGSIVTGSGQAHRLFPEHRPVGRPKRVRNPPSPAVVCCHLTTWNLTKVGSRSPLGTRAKAAIVSLHRPPWGKSPWVDTTRWIWPDYAPIRASSSTIGLDSHIVVDTISAGDPQSADLDEGARVYV